MTKYDECSVIFFVIHILALIGLLPVGLYINKGIL